MSNKIKRSLIGVLAIILLFVLFMTWFYPYSGYSIYKSYSYKPDPVVVDGYVEDLNEFKALFEDELEQEFSKVGYIDLTIDRTQYVIPLFEQDWLVSQDTVKISKRDLEYMLFEVKNVREVLLDLVARADYTKEQRDYLVTSIENIISLEELINDITAGNGTSRLSIKNQIHNLHGDFMNNFMMYGIFYERTTGTETLGYN